MMMARLHPLTVRVCCGVVGLGLMLLPVRVRAQVSLFTAVDMSLSHSPKVKAAEAEVAKARAALEQARDVYIPALTAGAGLGNSYGYSPNPPTLFTFNAQSLVFNFAQHAYIRSGRFGLTAADLSLLDVRQAVAEDTALTYLALQHDQQREVVLRQQNDLATRLVAIVEDRLDAGRDTAIDLTTAKLTAAQLRLARLRAEDDTARDQVHLALVMGIAVTTSLHADGEFPPAPAMLSPSPEAAVPATPAVAAAFATADSKRQLAAGESRYLYRPQFSLIAQYNRYATFTNSFKQLQSLNSGIKIGANEGLIAVQIQIPLTDRVHQAKARESAADAVYARSEAEVAQQTALDGQLHLRHSIEVLRARAEVAQLEQQLAQQQLDALSAQLQASSSNPNAPQMSPSDEQNSRIAEREKYLAVIDANYQLHQAEINLLRETGQLEAWLKQAGRTTP